jgi:uncharacterized protein (TIRG00374 family)
MTGPAARLLSFAACQHEGMPLLRRSRNPRRPRLRKGIRWGLGIFVVLLVLFYLVLPRLTGAKSALHDIGHVNIAYLAGGVLLEIASLLAYAQLTRTVLPTRAPSRPRILQINMSTLSLSHVMPGGTAAGAALGYRLYTQNDVSGPDASFAIAMQGVGSAVVLNVIFWVALFISLFFHGYNPLYAVAAGAGVLMMGVFATVVVLLTRGRRLSIEFVHNVASKIPFLDADGVAEALQRIADRLRALAQEKELLRRAVIWAAANWLLDAASLWVFIAAFHNLVNPIDLLVAYGLANIIAVIPITPSGLGVVEGVMIPTLVGFGVPRTVAVLGVLGWRAVNFWLPIPIGGATYLSLRFTSEGWRERIRSARKEIEEPEKGSAAEGGASEGPAKGGPSGAVDSPAPEADRGSPTKQSTERDASETHEPGDAHDAHSDGNGRSHERVVERDGRSQLPRRAQGMGHKPGDDGHQAGGHQAGNQQAGDQAV